MSSTKETTSPWNRRSPTIALVILIACSSVANGQNHPVADAKGFQQNREYFSELPFENVDMLSGSLVLRFTDLVLPGNAGKDLRFTRTFNSKLPNAGWTFGVAGVILNITDPPFPPVGTADDLIARPRFYTSDGADQQALWMHTPNTTSDTAIQRSLRWVSTPQFGRYDRHARLLYLPDGTTCAYEAPSTASRRVTRCEDPFRNSVTFQWFANALVVTQYLEGTRSREVTLTIAGGRVTQMEFAGRMWRYHWNAGVLERVEPPAGPSWHYGYSSDGLASVTTPRGGVIEYQYQLHDFLRLRTPQPGGVWDTVISLVVTQRTTSGRGITPGQWRYEYKEDDPENPAGQTTIVTASEQREGVFVETSRTSYHNRAIVPSDVVVPGGDWGLAERVVVDLNGSTWVTLQREVLTYTPIPVAINIGTAELASRTIQRNGRDYVTLYDYSSANFGNYHQPSSIRERGDNGRGRCTTRSYFHRTLPFDPVEPIPPLDQASHFITARLEVETVEPGQQAGQDILCDGELFVTSRTYDTTTGFRLSETAYGITTTFEKYGFGDVSRATRAGKSTSFTYEWGLLKDIQTPLHRTEREINSEGTVAAETQAGRRTAFSYDPLFRLTSTQPPGSRTPIVMDYTDGTATVTSRGASRVTTTLDGFGRPTGRSNSMNVRTRQVYDAEGRVVYESYPFETTDIGSLIQYDALGRVTKRTNPDGSFSTITYGPGTVTIRETVRGDQMRQTVQTLEAFADPDEARLVALTDAEGKTWNYTYNVIGKLTSADAANDTGEIVRRWEYITGTDRLQQETHPESGVTTYQYDAAGNLSQKTDANGRPLGQSFVYTYDANDRLERVVINDQHTIITYEPGTDNRASVTHRGVTTRFTYESASGRLGSRTVETDGRPYQVVFEYDADDNVTGIWYPSGRRVVYEHDSEGRVVNVRDGSPGVTRNYATSIGYHPSGAVASYLAGNGVPHTLTYHPQRYWPASIRSGPLSLTYENYDALGNVGRIVDGDPTYTQTFEYDLLDRLTRAQGKYGSVEYRYDVHGNRVTWGGTSYDYDPATLRLRQQDIRPFTYDANGNLKTEPNRQYTYTPYNMIETITGDGASTYAYDGDQWRVKKIVGPDTTVYIRGSNNELLTEWTNPSVTPPTFRDYIYAGTRLLAVVKQP